MTEFITNLETIECFRGDTLNPKQINFKDDAGTYIDITGYTVWFTVRATVPNTSIKADTDAVFTKELTGTNSGYVTVQITSTETDVTPMTYYYDIQYKKPTVNTIKTVGVGKFIIKPECTRDR